LWKEVLRVLKWARKDWRTSFWSMPVIGRWSMTECERKERDEGVRGVRLDA
jgi:hypothetical protein